MTPRAMLGGHTSRKATPSACMKRTSRTGWVVVSHLVPRRISGRSSSSSDLTDKRHRSYVHSVQRAERPTRALMPRSGRRTCPRLRATSLSGTLISATDLRLGRERAASAPPAAHRLLLSHRRRAVQRALRRCCKPAKPAIDELPDDEPGERPGDLVLGHTRPESLRRRLTRQQRERVLAVRLPAG